MEGQCPLRQLEVHIKLHPLLSLPLLLQAVVKTGSCPVQSTGCAPAVPVLYSAAPMQNSTQATVF